MSNNKLLKLAIFLTTNFILQDLINSREAHDAKWGFTRASWGPIRICSLDDRNNKRLCNVSFFSGREGVYRCFYYAGRGRRVAWAKAY